MISESIMNDVATDQEKKARQQIDLASNQILQLLRQAYFSQFFVRLNSGGGTFGTTADQTAILASLANALGLQTLPNNTFENFPGSTYGNLQFSLNLTLPKFTVGSGSFSSVTGTGTWLDGGVTSRLHAMPVTLQFQASIREANELQTSVTRTVYLCEIPADALALYTEGNLATLGNGASINGTSRIAGSVTASQSLNVNGALVYGTASSGTGVTQNNGSLTRTNSGFNFRGTTEILEQTSATPLCSSSAQSVVDPKEALPPSVLCREGLVGQSYFSIAAGQLGLYSTGQPYYSVPSGNRYVGTASGGVFTPRSLWPSGDGGNAASLPSWITPSIQTVNGTTYTVLTVNTGAAITGSTPLKLFIAAASPTNPNDFSQTLVVLSPTPELNNGGVTPASVSVITPNTLVFNGDWNYDSSNPAYTPIPTTILAGAVRFGFSALNAVNLIGSLHGNADLPNVMQGTAVDGTTPSSQGIHLQSTNSAAENAILPSAGQMFYITLVSQS